MFKVGHQKKPLVCGIHFQTLSNFQVNDGDTIMQYENDRYL